MDREQQKQDQQQQQQEKAKQRHFCRICNKGFGCGRALGGHMRSHGINDEPVLDSDDEPPNAGGAEWYDRQFNPPAGSKRMYDLRANSARPRSYRVCENCGREFQTWKSFLDHGRCISDDDPDEFSPPSSPLSDEADGCPAPAWYKGKRSRRAKPAGNTPTGHAAAGASTEEEELARCLVMLSAARVDSDFVVAETEESSASASKDEEDDDQENAIQCQPAASNPSRPKLPDVVQPTAPITPPVPRGMFECKACKKVFASHQALGGHRASHKKVKGCFAARLDPDLDEGAQQEDDADQNGASSATALAIVPYVDSPQPLASAPLKKKSKVHECSICHRQFASGQALGGHKRCHWITSSSGSVDPVPTVAVKLHTHVQEVGSSSGARHHDFALRPMFDGSDTLDLNLPAPINDLTGIPLRLGVPAGVYIKPPWNFDSKGKVVAETSSNDVNDNNDDEKDLLAWNAPILDDEAESRVKLAKLSDLRDMDEGGESSPWLQVGIGGSSAAKEGRSSDRSS